MLPKKQLSYNQIILLYIFIITIYFCSEFIIFPTIISWMDFIPFKSGFEIIGYSAGAFFLAGLLAQQIALHYIQHKIRAFWWSFSGLLATFFSGYLFFTSCQDLTRQWRFIFLIMIVVYLALHVFKRIINKDNIFANVTLNLSKIALIIIYIILSIIDFKDINTT